MDKTTGGGYLLINEGYIFWLHEKTLKKNSGLKDYKIFNFNGESKIIEVDYDRFVNHKRNLYTTDWEYINMTLEYPTDPNVKISKPKSLENMLDLAQKLSKGIPHVRTDFYYISDKVYFGEMTFFHGSGFERFNPENYNMKIGSWLKLPKKN